MNTNSNQIPLRVAYLLNPNPVFYNEMDHIIADLLEKEGVEVKKFNLQDISIKFSSENKIQYYLNNEEYYFDGLFNYGYMSSFSYEGFLSLVQSAEEMNKLCLHTVHIQRILDNKYLQAIYYAKNNIPIPESFAAFGLQGSRQIFSDNFANEETSIIKTLAEYGGDGVTKCDYTDKGMNNLAKLLWANQYCLVQKYVKDVFGKSIRVVCYEGKAYSLIAIEDLTSNFKSNGGYHDNCNTYTLEGTEKESEYKTFAEKAVASIDKDIIICGVDIIDSPEQGLLLLEINSWPELFDQERVTGQPVFKKLVETYVRRLKKMKQRHEE